MSKVLFLSFQENSDVIGVKYLHALLNSIGHDSSILLIPDNSRLNVDAAIAHIQESAPDVLCLSAMSYEFRRAADFIRELKARVTPCPPIIMGGIHATADPEGCLDIADAVVRGEGEETLPELLRVLADKGKDGIGDVLGLVYRKDGRLVETGVRLPYQNLDGLPFPGHLPEKMYVTHRGTIGRITEPRMYKKFARYQGAFLSVVSSRGCPFSCTYCCNSTLSNLYGAKSIRRRSPENVVQEIARETRSFDNLLYVNFQDDCFMTHPTEWIAAFCRMYKAQVGIPFIVRSTPRHVTREKLVMLKEAGLRWVFMGLQTGSDKISREIYKRNVTAQEFIDVARDITDLNLSAWYDVILDNPYETEADHMATIDVLLRTPKPFQFDLFSLDFFPGTELRERALNEGLPVPEVGAKSYTKPEPIMINRYIRMTATVPRAILRPLVAMRHNAAGRVIGMACYYMSLMIEPFIYLWMVHKSNDFSLRKTYKVLQAFHSTAFSKLYLRKQG